MKLIREMDLGQKYYLANLYDKNKKYKEAIALMLDVLKDHPENAQALNFIGYLMLENDSDLDEAYALIKKAIEIEPNDAFIRDSLGWYFFKIGKLEKALIELKKAWNSEKKDVVISKHLAIVYQKLNNDLEAQRYFSEALKNCKRRKSKERDFRCNGEENPTTLAGFLAQSVILLLLFTSCSVFQKQRLSKSLTVTPVKESFALK